MAVPLKEVWIAALEDKRLAVEIKQVLQGDHVAGRRTLSRD